ncbi:MAG: insulinase family protein, partial [Schleiferiaceae bacterium]|nr:insulinase family protein [Schleiferiaceae bacterium]
AGSASRLFNNLREDKAFTYGAYSSYGTSKYVSSINASAEVRNEVTDSSVVEFLMEIDRMRSEIVGEEELQNAKNFLAGAFGRSLENPVTVATFAFNNMYFDLDADYYNGYLKRLSTVTSDDVMRVAKTYLSAEALTVVIVGKASEIAQPLERLGLPIRYVTSQAEATTAPIVRKAEGMTAADVMGNYYTAIGGKSAIDALATFQMESEAKIMGMSIKSKTVYIAPGKYYEKQQSPQGTNETIVVDGQVKVVSSGNETPLDAEATAAVIQESVWLPELLWTTGEDGNVQLQADLQDVEGNPCYVLVVTDADDNLIKVFYNQATGLKVRESRVVPGPEGDMVLNMEISDYRDVNGIMMPHLTTMPVGPGMVLEFKTKVAIVNGEVDASVFE